MKHVTQYLAASLLFVTLAACGGTAAPLTPLASPTPTPPLRIFVQHSWPSSAPPLRRLVPWVPTP